MVRVLIIAAGVIVLTAFCHTELIVNNNVKEVGGADIGTNMVNFSEAKIGIPVTEIFKALGDQMLDESVSGRADGILNLTSFLSTVSPGTTALIFVPVTTILLGLAGIEL